MAVDFTPDPKLYPFTSRWFDSSRGRLRDVEEGTGPALLLCHGNPTWSFLYRTIITALRERFGCIAVDQLGFGLSERPAGFGYTAIEHVAVIGELIDHLNLDGYLSMGQDWGGPISLGAAARPLLSRLAEQVPARLGSKPALIFCGMRDPAFRPGMRHRVRAAFTDQVLIELPAAGHFIREDAPGEIAAAIIERFG